MAGVSDEWLAIADLYQSGGQRLADVVDILCGPKALLSPEHVAASIIAYFDAQARIADSDGV